MRLFLFEKALQLGYILRLGGRIFASRQLAGYRPLDNLADHLRHHADVLSLIRLAGIRQMPRQIVTPAVLAFGLKLLSAIGAGTLSNWVFNLFAHGDLSLSDSQHAMHHEERPRHAGEQFYLRTGTGKHWSMHFGASVANGQRPLEVWPLVQAEFYPAFIKKVLRLSVRGFGRQFDTQSGQQEIGWKDQTVTAFGPERVWNRYVTCRDDWRNRGARSADRSSQRAQKLASVHSLAIIPQGAPA